MDYTAQLTGRTPSVLEVTNITQSEALGGGGDVAKLNLLYISDASAGTGAQQVQTTNVNGIIPVLYKPDGSDSFYYADDDSDISSEYGVYHKIHEAHIPYIHGQLVNHGKLPFNVYNTVASFDQDANNDTNVVSSLNAADLINNVARVLVTDTDNNIYLLGYDIDGTEPNAQVSIRTLGDFHFNDDTSDPIDDWGQTYTAT